VSLARYAGPLRRALRDAAEALPPLARARDAARLRARMRLALGREPDLRRPRSFNEIVAHKALTDRDPRIPRTTDKLAVRAWLAERGMGDLLVPLVGGPWSCAAEIGWDALPDRFVLKASHGSGMTLPVTGPVTDRAADRAALARLADTWLAGRHDAWTGEWGYRGIPPRLLAERMLEGPDGRGPPPDWKFLCVQGRPRLLQLHLDRFGEHRMLWFDAATLERLPIGGPEARATIHHPPPEVARHLAALAARLAEGFALVRIDLYWAEGRAWFGEITHYPGGGVIRFDPPEWDAAIGAMVRAEGVASP
jgi:hypothetical protein